MDQTVTSSREACTCLSLEYKSYDEIAAEWFSECLFTWRERSSFYIGMTSLLFWILCQLPQMVKNYRDKSTEGLATFLLIQWLCGDTMNLIGSILTQQLSFQKLSAGLFVCMDLMIISQKILYSRRKSLDVAIRNNSSMNTLLITTLAVLVLVVESQAESADRITYLEVNLIQSCEPSTKVSSTLVMVGNILGWASSCCYVGSRIAQILKNRERQSADGIANTMFIFAILGNLTYSIGILLRDDRLVKAIPWLMGSLTCMMMDVFIVFQLNYYSRRTMKDSRLDSLIATPELMIRRSLLDS